MKKNLGPKIIELRKLGYSYNKIQFELKCSKGAIAYYINPNEKNNCKKRTIKNRATILLSKKVFDFTNKTLKEQKILIKKERTLNQRLSIKIMKFNCINHKGAKMKSKFTVEELKERIKNVKCCELSGRPLDITNTTSWHLDHKIPVSRGGDNSLDNVAILAKEVNFAKHNMTNDELIQLCKDILIFNGYKIN